MHGLFGAGRNWGAIARKLSATHRVVSLDLPDHGESPWVDILNYEVMAQEVATFLRNHGLYGAATLLGHSMGGKVGMTLALNDPNALAGLIVADIAPVAYQGHGNADIIDALLSLPLDTLSSRTDIDAALAPKIGDPMLRSYLLANLRRDGDRFAWRLNLAGLKESLPALLDFPRFDPGVRFAGPTLFIEGGRSDYVRDEDRAEIHARFPAAKIEIVPDAGHWVHADAPDAVVRLVENFMTV